jgi:signal transduction histidine kinase
MGPPEGHEDDWLLPRDFYGHLPAEAWREVYQLYRQQASMLIQDVQGEDGDRLPAGVRGPLRRAGVVSQLLTPFGAGAEMLGLIVADRMHSGHPWTPAEISAVEWIAADAGRGLHHARLYEAGNRLVEQLRSVDRVKSDFLANVSHELRTPLTSIVGYLELLGEHEAGPSSSEYQEMLETLGRNTARLQSLIEDVLTLAKIESGTFTTAVQPVSLAEVISAALAALRPQAAAQGVSLSAAPLASSMMVSGDPGQLDRALINLLANAVKFTPRDGQVTITAAADGGMAVVRVADTGIGIPEADQEELFTRFFRASNTAGRGIPGAGLGLAIVRTIVDNHGGQVDLRSREGEGTTVTIRIPLLAATAPSPRLPRQGQNEKPPGRPLRSAIRPASVASAISAGVREPMFSPTGRCTRAISAAGTPSAVRAGMCGPGWRGFPRMPTQRAGLASASASTAPSSGRWWSVTTTSAVLSSCPPSAVSTAPAAPPGRLRAASGSMRTGR